jgi:hypothetical protein
LGAARALEEAGQELARPWDHVDLPPITAGAFAEVLLSQVFKDREQVSRGVASRLSLSSSATSSRRWRMWR